MPEHVIEAEWRELEATLAAAKARALNDTLAHLEAIDDLGLPAATLQASRELQARLRDLRNLHAAQA